VQAKCRELEMAEKACMLSEERTDEGNPETEIQGTE
jgi:hypothetical protein